MTPVIVISCGGGVNGLGIVRSLGRHGISTHVVTKCGGGSLAARSRYCSRVHLLEEEMPDAVSSVLAEIISLYRCKPILMCDSDEALHLVSLCGRELLEQLILPCPLERFAQLQDKQYQAETARKAGIPVPQSWYLHDWNDLDDVHPAPGRRLIVKPNPAVFPKTAPFKIFWANDADDARRRLKRVVTSPEGMIVQEYIEGDDRNMFVASGYRSKRNSATTMVTIAKVKQSGTGAGGIGIIAKITDSPELERLTSNLLSALGYYGPFALEFKYCTTQKEFVFIEANYRTAKIHVIGRRSGADVPAILYSDVTGSKVCARQATADKPGAWYYDMWGCCETLPKTSERRMVLLMLREIAMAPFRKTEWAVFAWDDWNPFFKAFSRNAIDVARRFTRRLRRRSRDANLATANNSFRGL